MYRPRTSSKLLDELRIARDFAAQDVRLQTMRLPMPHDGTESPATTPILRAPVVAASGWFAWSSPPAGPRPL